MGKLHIDVVEAGVDVGEHGVKPGVDALEAGVDVGEHGVEPAVNVLEPSIHLRLKTRKIAVDSLREVRQVAARCDRARQRVVQCGCLQFGLRLGNPGCLELLRVVERVEMRGGSHRRLSVSAKMPSSSTDCRQNGMSSSKSSTFFFAAPPLLLPAPAAPAPAVSRRAGAPPPPLNSTSPPPPSRLPPISCMRSPTISVEYFSTPSLSVYLRVCNRPSM